MREYILCLVAAAAVTYLLTPLARELAKKWKVMAPVRDRDVHDTPTPLLGGLAMVGGLLAGGILASKLPMMSAVFDLSKAWIHSPGVWVSLLERPRSCSRSCPVG